MEYDFFISYSRADILVVKQFAQSLSRMNYTVWIDKNGSHVGDHFKKNIVEAILSSRVVLFFSSAAAKESKFVTNEIGVAVKHNKAILPIHLDSSHYNTQVELDLVNINYETYYLADRNEYKFNQLINAICKQIELKKPIHEPKPKTIKDQDTDTLPPPPPPPPPIPQMPLYRNYNPLKVKRKFVASFFEQGLNVQAGHITIEEDTLIFKANKINFGDTKPRTWEIHRICGYKKVFPYFLEIYFNNGKVYKFTLLLNRAEVKKILEERRINYYKTKGLMIPPLTINS